MALRLRRGSNAERLQITPAEGEIIYTTDTKKIYVGDGNRLGGNLVSGMNETVEDASPHLGGDLNINGRNIIGTGNINITGNITATGLNVSTGTLTVSAITSDAITSDITGSVFGDDSTVLVDAINNKINLANNLLTELEDVSASNPTNGNVLTWNSTLMAWEASQPASSNNGTGSWNGSVYNADGSLLLVDGTVGTEKIYLNNNTLIDLADVSYDDTSIQNDWVLAWNATLGKFSAKSITIELGDIIGTGDPAPTLVDTINNKVYLANNKLTDLNDVILPENPTHGYVLKYDDQQGWIQSTVIDTGSITSLNPLSIPYIDTQMVTGDLTGGVYANDGTLLVDPASKTFALEENDLHSLKNVSAAANNPNDNSILCWNSAISMWDTATINELIYETGFIHADAFKGSLFADDSSIIVDALTNKMYPSEIEFPETKLYTNFEYGELTLATNLNPSFVLLSPITADKGRPNLELKTIRGTVDSPDPVQPGDWLFNIWWSALTNRPGSNQFGKDTFGNLFCRIPSDADFVNDTHIPSEWIITNNHRTEGLNINGFLKTGAFMTNTLQLSRMDVAGNFVHFADTTARDNYIENSPVEGMITYVQDRGDGTPAFLGYKGGSVNAWVNLEQNSTPTVYGSSDVDSHLNTGTAADGQILSWNTSLLSGAGDYEWVAQTGSTAVDIVSEGNTSVETVDTGIDGEIKFTTEGTHRWSFDSSGHLIPTTNAAYDFGSAEFKIRHFYLSNNSLYIGDDFTFGVSEEDGQPEFRKRKQQANHIPKRILALALADVALNLADAAAVIAHALAWMNTQLDPDATDLSDKRITLKLWWLYGNDNIADFATTIPDPTDILPPPGDSNFDKGDYDQIIKLGQQGFAKSPILDGSAPIMIPLKANFPYFIINNVTGPFDVMVNEVPPVEGGSFKFTLYVNQGAGGGTLGAVIIKDLQGNNVPVDPINIRTVGSVVENSLQVMEVKAFFLAGSWKIINQII